MSRLFRRALFGYSIAAVGVSLLLCLMPTPQPATATDVAWLTRLSEGYSQAQARGQPILVKIESANSDACRKFNFELERPEVLTELKRWTLVALNAEASAEAKTLEFESVPALRILTSHGRVVAGSDGFVRGEELLAFLRQHRDGAAAEIPIAIGSSDALTPDAVTKLIAVLGERDAVIREMAARRLLAEPKLAAKPVAEALGRGNLQTRIAALDLLRDWGGPVADLDPWQQTTLTRDRLNGLVEWAAGAGPKADRTLTIADREELRDELLRLTNAPAADAIAIRERLVRYGPAARELVLAELPNAATDLARERLVALRYRLAATDALVLRWPDGLDRLAANQIGTRHEAVKELARIATATEEPLLLELFADADPFVRELSLRALQAASGKSATGAIAKLLDDPDPNVRAAVLKQIAESPSPKLVAKIGEYLSKEKDVDLAVHAVKALRSARGKESLEYLKPLFRHESWRVRAEAIESAGEILSNLRQGTRDQPEDEAYKTIRAALADSDGFVVGRAIGVLSKLSKAGDFEALVAAAAKHPELTGAVVKALDYSSDQRAAALPHLRKFCQNTDPSVRAAAIKAVCTSFGNTLPPELLVALKDPESSVRQSAADALFHELGSLRSSKESDAILRDEVIEPADNDPFQRRMTKLFAPTVPLLEKMLTADPDRERLSSARVLIALGREKDVLPVLRTTIQKNTSLVSFAAAVLSWVSSEVRRDLCRQFIALKPGPEQIIDVIDELAKATDPKLKDLLWELSTRDDVPLAAAERIAYVFNRQVDYSFSRNIEQKTPDQVKLIETAVGKAADGPILQRFTAVLVLSEVDPPRAAGPAAALATAPNVGAVRRDALLVAMLTTPNADAEKMAIDATTDADALVRQHATMYLCFGKTAPFKLPSTGTWLRIDSNSRNRSNRSEFVPRVPRTLDVAVARMLLRDEDAATAAGAGYLLAVLGDPSGLPALTRYWREHLSTDWGNLLAMAIASLEDDAIVPILEEIYQQLNPLVEGNRTESEIRRMYWIIRPMEGPNALRLRKKMRAEVGMEVIGSPQ
jgi:HEAT repeat protein